MNIYEIVSLSAYNYNDHWMVEVRWKVSRDDTEPLWHAHRVYDLELPPHDLAALLGSISELLYDHADEIAGAAARASAPAIPSGGVTTIPLFPDL